MSKSASFTVVSENTLSKFRWESRRFHDRLSPVRASGVVLILLAVNGTSAAQFGNVMPRLNSLDEFQNGALTADSPTQWGQEFRQYQSEFEDFKQVTPLGEPLENYNPDVIYEGYGTWDQPLDDSW